MAYVRRYLLSIEVRADTKISLLIGLFIGTLCVILIALYPGNSIDYSNAGKSVWAPSMIENPSHASEKMLPLVFVS